MPTGHCWLLSATVAIAAQPTISRAIAREGGVNRGFRYLAEERHDFAKVTGILEVVKNKFLNHGRD